MTPEKEARIKASLERARSAPPLPKDWLDRAQAAIAEFDQADAEYKALLSANQAIAKAKQPSRHPPLKLNLPKD